MQAARPNGADCARDVPEREERGEDDEPGAVCREDLLDAVVDRPEGGQLQVRLHRRRNRLAPDVLLPRRAEDREAEQRERDQRLQHLEGDRARVIEQLVAVE